MLCNLHHLCSDDQKSLPSGHIVEFGIAAKEHWYFCSIAFFI